MSKTCANCGSPVAPTDQFCTECGHEQTPSSTNSRRTGRFVLVALGVVVIGLAAIAGFQVLRRSDLTQEVTRNKSEAVDLTQEIAAERSEEVLVIDLKYGPVKIALRSDLAPNHVARVKQLASERFYDGLKFHRVIAGFMAQTGDPTGTGTGGSNYPDLPAEFSQEPYKRGTIGAARTVNPNSANSQFFICFTDTGCSSLTGQYTVWGEVIEGMESVDKIAPGEPPAVPDVLQKVYVESDTR